ncbi:MAG: DNA polymerase I [Gemmatimonadota bacterium]|nr:DNA polymerase I [Gemmatimonadota bacterium]
MAHAARPRLFLVDGYALIYRAFFAMIGRPLTTSNGENTSVAWGVANFLLRLVRAHHPEYLAWVHDAGTSFRHEVFPEYKATREKLEPELQEVFDHSIERVEQLLTAFRVPLIAEEGYEADDVIGTLAQRAVDHGWDAVIISGDKDFYQLVSAHIALLNPGRGGPAAVDEMWVDASNAAERLGVPPERVVDYLALVGDASDNVPGVRGVGDKTARALIEAYGDLDNILGHASEVTGKRPREALLAHADNARLSRELVTIRRDVPVRGDLAALAAAAPDREALAALFTELEFHSLIPQLAAPAPPTPPTRDLVTDPASLPAVVATLRREAPIAVATLADGPDRRSARLVGLCLAGTAQGFYFPFAHRAPAELGATDPENLPPLSDPALRPLRDVLSDPAVPKLGHDVKADCLTLRGAAVDLAGVEGDTMVAGFLLEPGKRSYALDVLALERLGQQVSTPADLLGRGRSERPAPEVAPAEAGQVLAAATRAVHRLAAAMEPELASAGLDGLLREIELPLIRVLVEMEWRGIAVDLEGLAALSRRFGEELQDLERRIHADAGMDFNINSTPQLRHVLFEKLQLPIIKKTKTGASTDADVLAQLAEMGFTTPALLLEYRELTKLRSTYVDVLPQRVNPATGRIHTTFNQAGAATGRLSSADPNLQNIPVRTARGEEIRRCFVAAPGHRLVVADYSQIELRVLAHLSEDKAFITAFGRGGDIHRETAAIIFDVPVGTVTPEMRARAKTINFATIYGQGAFALSGQLGISQDEARAFIATYFERFAGVRRFLDDTVERARAQGFVETLFGRRRYIPELQDRNRNVRAFGERTAMNSPMQGSAADLIKIAMIRLAEALRDAGLRAGLLLQVHDELVLEAPDDEVQRVRALVREHMEGAARLRVPLVADVSEGDNWMDAKP